MKKDKNKIKAALIFQDFPNALLEVAKVASHGAEKYEPHGWLLINNGQRRYADAKARHMIQAEIERHDKESGLLHKAHEIWNALAVLEKELTATQRLADAVRDYANTRTESTADEALDRMVDRVNMDPKLNQNIPMPAFSESIEPKKNWTMDELRNTAALINENLEKTFKKGAAAVSKDLNKISRSIGFWVNPEQMTKEARSKSMASLMEAFQNAGAKEPEQVTRRASAGSILKMAGGGGITGEQKEEPEWPEESRIDAIGQNGGDGEHYETAPDYFLGCFRELLRVRKEESENFFFTDCGRRVKTLSEPGLYDKIANGKYKKRAEG